MHPMEAAIRKPSLSALQNQLVPESTSPSSIATRNFEKLGMCYDQRSVLLAQSLGDFDVLEDGFVIGLFRTFSEAWSAYHPVSIIDTNQTIAAALAEPLFVSADRRSAVMYFDNHDFLSNGINWGLQHWNNVRSPKYFVGASGTSALGSTDSSGAQSELEKMDAISIPIALLVLAWRVRSLPLMVIPLLSLPISLLVAFTFLDAASSSTNFPSFAPALYISTSVALGQCVVYQLQLWLSVCFGTLHQYFLFVNVCSVYCS